jgi:hypothetical protein
MKDIDLYGYLSGGRSPPSWDFQFQQALCTAILLRDEQEIIEILKIIDQRAERAHTSTGYDTRWSILMEDLGEALAVTYATSKRDQRLLLQVSKISLTRSGDLPFDNYKRRKYIDHLGSYAADFLISQIESFPGNYFIVESLVYTGDPRIAVILANLLFLPTKTSYIKCQYIDWISESPFIANPFALVEPCVDDRDSDIRIHSLGALLALDATRAKAIVLELMSDDSPNVRRFAIEALQELHDLSTVDRIAKRLVIDAAVEVRIAAARTLGILKPVVAPPELISSLRDASNDVRGMSAWALGEIGDRTALDVLKACKDDLSESTSWSIVKAINVLESQ